MLRLEQVEKGMLIEGLGPDGPVEVVSADWVGEGALEVFYRDRRAGGTGEATIYRSHEPMLKAVEEQRRGFTADGGEFRLVVEAQRMRLAYLSDPRLAVHTSQVEPLPHQISAVYERMLPLQPLRFLLADDPGAGKTIMAGLLMKELVARSALERCLVVCPGGLVEQWQDELRQKFDLDFEIIGREQVEASYSGNPFREKGFVIGRLDHMARNEGVLESLSSTHWDLIVVDEAHKMSATVSGGEVDRTKRYQLGERLSGLTRHLLLMTATPHNGKEEDFRLFLKLLDPDRFEGRLREKETRLDATDIMRRMVKEDLKRFDGAKLFPERVAHTVSFELSGEEARLYDAVTDYVREEFNRVEAMEGRRRTVGFALTILQRRLASSPEAIYSSLQRRRERLQRRLNEVEHAGGLREDPRLRRLADSLEDYEELPGEEVEESEEEVMDLATAARNARELEAEISTLTGLERMAREVRRRGVDHKWARLRELLGSDELTSEEGEPRKLIVFTEHRDTLTYLRERLVEFYSKEERVVTISGGMSRSDRQRAQERFLNDPHATVLVATDAAGEGVNLQRANLMVNYDLPWNPNRLEQRFGRIHRIGQTRNCYLWNMVAGQTREGAVYSRLLDKLETERKALSGRVFDVLGELFKETSLRELLVEAIRNEGRGGLSPEVERKLESVMDHERLRSLVHDSALTHEAMDPAMLEGIRDDMERAEARRLQPHFVESFFIEGYRRLGGKVREWEDGRHDLGRLPQAIYQRARALPGGRRLHYHYDRVTFDRSLVRMEGSVPAKFLYPGHPLFDAVVRLTLERLEGALEEGAVLVDDADSGVKPRVLVLAEHTVFDGYDRMAGRRMAFVEIGADGEPRDGGPAPHLDYRPLREEEQRAAYGLIEDFGTDVERRAHRYAAAELAREHLEEVSKRRLAQVERIERAVNERLRHEISHWDAQEARWREQERQTGRPEDRLQASNAASRSDELVERRRRRMGELKRERALRSAPPRILGAAIVVPAGALGATPPPAFPEEDRERRRVERLAMEAVMEAERALGCEPRDVSAENRGYDIESRDPEGGMLRMIEVKGRVSGAETVTVTRNEILTSLNRPREYVLALVEVEGERATEPRYVRAPFSREPDFGTISVNYDLRELLRRSTRPG